MKVDFRSYTKVVFQEGSNTIPRHFGGLSLSISGSFRPLMFPGVQYCCVDDARGMLCFEGEEEGGCRGRVIHDSACRQVTTSYSTTRYAYARPQPRRRKFKQRRSKLR